MPNTRLRHRRHRGVFISFEGIEGSGKTTQLARLAKLLREEGCRVVETREPGGTPIAERIREILLGASSESDHRVTSSAAEPLTPACEATLVFAARSQHMAMVIAPALTEGAVVLCDRFADSTLAYQGYARGLALRDLRGMNRLATRGVMPDLTLLFDLPVNEGLRRRRRLGTEQNRLDRESIRFHNRVRRGFLDLQARDPRRIRLIDASGNPDDIADRVAAIVRKYVSRRSI
ncbi:MAG TPA: dTMP kinase [Nitrospiraceae bacterium]|nr:dTMP kinase [Nitrospiraceae bacterium]